MMALTWRHGNWKSWEVLEAALAGAQPLLHELLLILRSQVIVERSRHIEGLPTYDVPTLKDVDTAERESAKMVLLAVEGKEPPRRKPWRVANAIGLAIRALAAAELRLEVEGQEDDEMEDVADDASYGG